MPDGNNQGGNFFEVVTRLRAGLKAGTLQNAKIHLMPGAKDPRPVLVAELLREVEMILAKGDLGDRREECERKFAEAKAEGRARGLIV
jgi:hypothetical protein